MREKNRTGQDYLPASDDKPMKPCVVVAARDSFRLMIAGSIVSNCAKGIVQAPTCSITPNNIDVRLAALLGKEAEEVKFSDVSIKCTERASVTVETNTGETIPLGGTTDAVAVLDWGRGYGNSVTLTMESNTPKNIPLRVKTHGVSTMGAGVISGSAVVNISYD
ncbi:MULTISPECIES: hypothetical protein [unclassified Serratia (in: enterobacteria)]|uniref:hypothetical protein n=1 Tax=unclassified Serratia (in: enterobacteria) TaxID=2647522 RepID=UPI002ED04EB3|nr:hypothetical protein [Serratia sp. C2(2)]MEE4447624.1 hypothetical protein [Serratia sp. C2(1)]